MIGAYARDTFSAWMVAIVFGVISPKSRIATVKIPLAIATKEPERKRVEGYKSIVTLNKVDEENGLIDVSASEF